MSTSTETPAHEREFAATPSSLVDVRRLVESAGEATTLTRAQMGDLLTAVDEAAANAIRHGCGDGHTAFRVKIWSKPNGLKVSVHDHGTGFTNPCAVPMPGPEAMGGRGLPLMCALSDSVEFASSATGTSVTLKKFTLES